MKTELLVVISGKGTKSTVTAHGPKSTIRIQKGVYALDQDGIYLFLLPKLHPSKNHKTLDIRNKTTIKRF